MTVPLNDLKLLYDRHHAEIDAAIARVVASHHFILGPEVASFEAELGRWMIERGGRPDLEVIGVSSGSAALLLAMMALGIGAGDEVIVPAYSFFATAGAPALASARPVFVDVDPETLLLDLGATLDAVTGRTRAVIPVHLFGRPFATDALRAGLDAMGREDIVIVEDAAQSFGSLLRGRPSGSMTRLACLSFFPSKNLGCFGDGGAVVASGELAQRIRTLRTHGAERKYWHEMIGINSRLDAMQAAILRARLPHLDGWITERRVAFASWSDALRPLRDAGHLRLPPPDAADALSAWNQFVIRADRRDALRAFLTSSGVETTVYYPHALSSLPCFAHLTTESGACCSLAVAATGDSLALPFFPGITDDQIARAASAIGAFYGVASAR